MKTSKKYSEVLLLTLWNPNLPQQHIHYSLFTIQSENAIEKCFIFLSVQISPSLLISMSHN